MRLPSLRTAVALWLVAVLVSALVAAIALGTLGDDPDSARTQHAGTDEVTFIDYRGLRIDIPSGFFVQDIEGLVDGELACPDARGYMYVGFPVTPAVAIYSDASCGFTHDPVVIRIRPATRSEPYIHFPDDRLTGPGTSNGIDYVRDGGGHAHILDPQVVIRARSDHLDSMLESLRPSPTDGELVPPTAPEPVTTATDDRGDGTATHRDAPRSVAAMTSHPADWCRRTRFSAYRCSIACRPTPRTLRSRRWSGPSRPLASHRGQDDPGAGVALFGTSPSEGWSARARMVRCLIPVSA